MKRFLFPTVALVLAAFGLLLSGCGGSSAAKIDTAELSQAFAGADATIKTSTDQAAKMLVDGQLAEGSTALMKVVKESGSKLTDPQRNALVNLCASIQMVMADHPEKMDEKVQQTVEDLIAALEDQEAGKAGVTPDASATNKPAAK